MFNFISTLSNISISFSKSTICAVEYIWFDEKVHSTLSGLCIHYQLCTCSPLERNRALERFPNDFSSGMTTEQLAATAMTKVRVYEMSQAALWAMPDRALSLPEVEGVDNHCKRRVEMKALAADS